jgi:RNA polymerase sigma-70 factor, ECF subfamily
LDHEDARLLTRIAAHDRDAMRELYDRYAGPLLRFATLRLRDPEEAADALQETMLAAWQSAPTFRGAATVSTWLFGICRHKVADQLRRRRATDPLSEGPGLATPDPADQAIGAVDALQALSRLSVEQQELLLLVFQAGLSQAEVAAVTEVPVGTIKSRVHYARRRLQALLTEEEPR